MPGKKAASKKKVSKKKKVTSRSARKRPAAKKANKAAKKRVAKKKATKKKVTKKKVAKKKAAKKKTTRAGKSGTKRKEAKKKVTRKKSAAKTATRKASSKKKVSKKKPATTRKASTKKKPATSKKPAAKKTTRKKRAATPRSNMLTGPIPGFEPYQPKRNEEYMGTEQLEHFRDLLLAWKRELMEEVDRTMHHMKDDASNPPDPNDRATQETEFGLELRTRDRERKLLKKIDSALNRIDDGSYGYCEETGEEIGLRRLEARPVATLCVEAQERRELAERQFRDREDYYR